MAIVYWCPVLRIRPNGAIHDSMDIFFQQPDPLFKALVAEYPTAEMLMCPAVQEFCKDTYVVRAPFDITYTYDANTNTLNTNALGQEFFDSFCMQRKDGSVETAPTYLFYAKESVKIEALPVFLLRSSAADATHFVPGQYDIGRWIRPVVWNFFIKDPTQPLVVSKGEPLFLVRFTPADGSRVEFERVEYDYKTIKVANACLGIKHYVTGVPLRHLYKLADSYIKSFFRRNT